MGPNYAAGWPALRNHFPGEAMPNPDNLHFRT